LRSQFFLNRPVSLLQTELIGQPGFSCSNSSLLNKTSNFGFSGGFLAKEGFPKQIRRVISIDFFYCFTIPSNILAMPIRIKIICYDKFCWIPFSLTIAIAVLCFIGLAYSFFPFIVPDQLLIIQAAAATSSLKIILVGALIVLPILIGYTFLSYKIFHGKASSLRYD